MFTRFATKWLLLKLPLETELRPGNDTLGRRQEGAGDQFGQGLDHEGNWLIFGAGTCLRRSATVEVRPSVFDAARGRP
jgi:hypothetical protein